jgi:hypothetical protein
MVWSKGFFDTHRAKKNPLANRSIIDDTGLLAAWEIHPVSAIKGATKGARQTPVAR